MGGRNTHRCRYDGARRMSKIIVCPHCKNGTRSDGYDSWECAWCNGMGHMGGTGRFRNKIPIGIAYDEFDIDIPVGYLWIRDHRNTYHYWDGELHIAMKHDEFMEMEREDG
jgi:hypothetical protein